MSAREAWLLAAVVLTVAAGAGTVCSAVLARRGGKPRRLVPGVSLLLAAWAVAAWTVASPVAGMAIGTALVGGAAFWKALH